MISSERARDVYGVVIDQKSLEDPKRENIKVDYKAIFFIDNPLVLTELLLWDKYCVTIILPSRSDIAWKGKETHKIMTVPLWFEWPYGFIQYL